MTRLRAVAFVIIADIAGLIAAQASAPVPEASPEPTPTPHPQLKPLVRPRWPGTFHRRLAPGATFSARPS